MSARALVAVITVSYRSCLTSLQFLRSIQSVKHFAAIDLIIVDNNSADGSAEELRIETATARNISVLESRTNRGYFGAAKWALATYLESHELPDWVIICNNDIIFTDENLFSHLFNYDCVNVGVVAPSILDESVRRDSNPFMNVRPKRLRIAELRFWLSNYYLASVHEYLSEYKRIWIAKSRSSANGTSGTKSKQPIYAPHGSFIIFNKIFFEKGGRIDGDFFLYAEEVSVGEMCRRVGVPVIYDPSLVVVHRDHQTRGKRFTRKIYQDQKDGFRHLTAQYLPDVSSLCGTGQGGAGWE